MTADVRDTIFALSSGTPPAAIAIVRVSGPLADHALEVLAGSLPEPRRASVATIRDLSTGETLDNGLVLRFPGPNSSTGEDVVEFHLHGGRSVVAAVLSALSRLNGMRAAEPGEFTRRAFEHGRIDLTEAEGLSDLLIAETQSQRRAALALAGGALRRKVENWRGRVLGLCAELEAQLDFSDEADVEDELPAQWRDQLSDLAQELSAFIAAPGIERLRDGVRVVIAGPPNAGKSTLLNALAGREAAITSAIPGTTRDLVEAPTSIGGTPFLLIDTAGLRDCSDEIEAIGVERARDTMKAADILLWLGTADSAPAGDQVVRLQSKADIVSADPKADLRVSASTGEGMERLTSLLLDRSRLLLPGDGEAVLNARHRAVLGDCLESIHDAARTPDLLIASEAIRVARAALDRVTGRSGVEDMLDALFGTFCIGK